MARDRKCSVHRNPSLAISVSALGLPIVQISHRKGSLIPNIRKTREMKRNESNHITLIYNAL